MEENRAEWREMVREFLKEEVSHFTNGLFELDTNCQTIPIEMKIGILQAFTQNLTERYLAIVRSKSIGEEDEDSSDNPE